MANLKIKIDGKKFINAFLFDFQGKTATKRCLCIPVDDNNIYLSEKGAAYIDLIAFESRQPSQYGDTHMIKHSLPKSKQEAMTEEQRRAMPILGNLAPLGNNQTTVPASSAAGSYTAPAPGEYAPTPLGEPEGDLPF